MHDLNYLMDERSRRLEHTFICMLKFIKQVVLNEVDCKFVIVLSLLHFSRGEQVSDIPRHVSIALFVTNATSHMLCGCSQLLPNSRRLSRCEGHFSLHEVEMHVRGQVTIG